MAAAWYIKLLAEDVEMINIDESVVNTTDKRSRGWFIKSKRNIVTHTQWLASMNIIAAVSNKGRFIYAVNKGNNNGYTMIHFLSS